MKNISTDKSVFFSLVCATVGFLFVFSTEPVRAETVKIKGETLQEKLQEITKQKEKYGQKINLKKKQKAVIDRQLQAIDREERTLEEKIKRNKKELEEARRKVERLSSLIAEQEKTIEGQRKILAGLLRSRYELGGADLSRQALASYRQTVADDRLARINDKISRALERMTKLREKTLADHRKLKEAQEKLLDSREKLAQRDSYLESTRNYKKYLKSKTSREIKKYARKLTALEEKEMEIRREMEQIELGKLDDINFAELPSREEADLRLPVDAVRLTQGYGKTSFSYVYRSGRHNAWDLALKNGKDAIRAAGDGRVLAVGNMGRYGYGRWIAIDHRNGLVTFYAHLRKVKVKSGQKVKKGDKIGVMGSTGFSTGTHVHFSVYAAKTFTVTYSKRVSGLKIPTGASINPARYLSLYSRKD